MKKSILIISLLLSACGTTTGVVKITDDTYMLAKQDFMTWSGAEVKVQLYKEANEFCAQQGKKFEQVTNTSTDAVLYQASAGAELQFKCK